MPRAVDGTRRHDRRKKILDRAKGYRGTRSILFKTAKETVARALQNAYDHRRQKKRQFRSLWIARISAACRNQGTTYSQFMNGLAKAGIVLNRMALSNMAIEDSAAFAALVEKAKAALKA